MRELDKLKARRALILHKINQVANANHKAHVSRGQQIAAGPSLGVGFDSNYVKTVRTNEGQLEQLWHELRSTDAGIRYIEEKQNDAAQNDQQRVHHMRQV